jgi:hypothetical protein
MKKSGLLFALLSAVLFSCASSGNPPASSEQSSSQEKPAEGLNIFPKHTRGSGCVGDPMPYYENGKAYVSVRDEGETIPPEDLPFIFDRFHKSDRSRSLDKDGVGLGLYLVKSIINSHDEDIAVKSENGVTEFVFTLSLAQ